MDHRRVLAGAVLGATLSCTAVCASAQSPSWDIPGATIRAVLQQWAQERGYGIVWSEGVPDFASRASRIDGDFASAVAQLVNGSAYGATNLYCPPAIRFPSMAYTPAARVDDRVRLIFVYGVPSGQECRPR